MIQPPTGQAPAPKPEEPVVGGTTPAVGIDLVKIKQYLHVIVRRIWIVTVCFVIAVVLSILKVSKQEAVYQSGTELLLSRGTPQIVKQMSSSDYELLIGDFVDTQIRIIQSRAVVDRARERLALPAAEINRLFRGSAVWAVGRSSLLYIQAKALDPQLAADYANALASAYVEFKSDEKSGSLQANVVTLTQVANRIREELKKAENAMILFKKEKSMVVSAAQKNTAADIMVNLAGRTAAYRLERMILEVQRPMLSDLSDDAVLTALGSRYVAQREGINQNSSVNASMGEGTGLAIEGQGIRSSPIGTVEFNEDISSNWMVLKKEKSRLEYELRKARESLRDNHPVIQKILAQLSDLEDAISREVRFATEKYFSELEALTLKESALTRVESMWLEEALNTELLMDQYRTLEGDVERLRALLNSALNRIRDADISEGVDSDMVTVLDAAVPSGSPIAPRKLQSIFTAGLLGIMIGIGIIFGLDMLDDSIRYPEDIAKYLGLKFLGLVPAASWSSNDLRTHLLSQVDPKSGLAESYRNIRAAMMQQDNIRKSAVLLVTSALPKEGKTTTSINLAISYAQAGMRVLVVDSDMRRGEVHKYFGLEGGRGLADVLNGQAKAESVIQRTGVSNLDLVATGPFPSNPAELILRNEFRTFMEYARRTYDKVIFDGPPVMAVSEAAVLASMADSTILVIWAAHTSRKLCQLTLQNLLQRGARVDGCILNNLEFGRVGYYYYSTYYGYYTYDYRYDDVSRPG